MKLHGNGGKNKIKLTKDWKNDNSCRWAFKSSPDDDFNLGLYMKFSKLFGIQKWSRYNNTNNDIIKINIQRI
tara:strand:- start:337 stop:552 length:216 start_codon:yes stop_codon:yes gene_type:complete